MDNKGGDMEITSFTETMNVLNIESEIPKVIKRGETFRVIMKPKGNINAIYSEFFVEIFYHDIIYLNKYKQVYHWKNQKVKLTYVKELF